jgi:hypothetical protein
MKDSFDLDFTPLSQSLHSIHYSTLRIEEGLPFAFRLTTVTMTYRMNSMQARRFWDETVFCFQLNKRMTEALFAMARCRITCDSPKRGESKTPKLERGSNAIVREGAIEQVKLSSSIRCLWNKIAHSNAEAMMFESCTSRQGAAARRPEVKRMQKPSRSGSIQTVVPEAPV